ncbi:MAG: GvpL/GvpF family gas vesicle protein, partial [Pseudonocardia sp.]|nr:GvpL/GvpF family gas vesicle protein [Pseudonocardia sp.]
HRRLAALVSDIPTDHALGTRDDLVGHERVLDEVAGSAAVLAMRFPAVVEEADVVDDLLAPHHDRFVEILAELDGRVQYTLKGSYHHDNVLRELLATDPEIRSLRERIDGLPEDASYYDRVRLGELVVGALETRREADAADMVRRLGPTVVATVEHRPANPDDVINAGFLVERAREREFSDAVEEVGREFDGRVRLRLLGPLAPYDFTPRE